MTDEQARLILEIVSRLDDYSMYGEYPDEHCRYCGGTSEGYRDSQSFEHSPQCITRLIRQLRETMQAQRRRTHRDIIAIMRHEFPNLIFDFVYLPDSEIGYIQTGDLLTKAQIKTLRTRYEELAKE